MCPASLCSDFHPCISHLDMQMLEVSFIHSFTRCEAVLATVAHTGKGSWQLPASPNFQSGEEDISINNRSKNDNSNHM